jgi:hypothetical protein
VEAKIDAYIKENPKYWAYLQGMPRDRLERTVVLNEVRQLERQQRMREGMMKRINANPELKQAYETLVKNVPEEQREEVMSQMRARRSAPFPAHKASTSPARSGRCLNLLTTSLTFFQIKGRLMKALTQYGRQAEKHWREHCPKMVRALEAQGQLHAMLLEAEEKTKDEMIELTQQFRKQGLTAQQAHDRAWEMVRENYILLPAET